MAAKLKPGEWVIIRANPVPYHPKRFWQRLARVYDRERSLIGIHLYPEGQDRKELRYVETWNLYRVTPTDEEIAEWMLAELAR
jgi:hypothetical protein